MRQERISAPPSNFVHRKGGRLLGSLLVPLQVSINNGSRCNRQYGLEANVGVIAEAEGGADRAAGGEV